MGNYTKDRFRLIIRYDDGQSNISSYPTKKAAQDRIIEDLRGELKHNVSYEIEELYPEQSLYESMVDTIEQWMYDNVYCDEDGYHNYKAAKDELQSLLEQFAEDVLRDEALNYCQATGGRLE